MKAKPGTPAHERILARVNQHARGCWLWPGALTSGKYGGYAVVISSRHDGPRRCLLAHRVIYEALVGPIPDGADLHHRCGVKRCVNPGHLVPIAHGEHQRQHGAERCRRCGSSEWKSFARTDRPGKESRRCMECARRMTRAYRRRMST